MDHEPGELAFTLPGVPASVPAARRQVRDFLVALRAPAPRIDDAAVVVSELATTAVLRRAARFSVRVRCRGGQVRIDVHHGALTSRSPVAEPDLSEGRKVSLAVLAGLAEVGHSIDGDGSLMWAEVR